MDRDVGVRGGVRHRRGPEGVRVRRKDTKSERRGTGEGRVVKNRQGDFEKRHKDEEQRGTSDLHQSITRGVHTPTPTHFKVCYSGLLSFVPAPPRAESSSSAQHSHPPLRSSTFSG